MFLSLEMNPKVGIDNFTLDQIIEMDSVALPVFWGSLGQDLVKGGVIDKEKLVKLYESNPNVDYFLSNNWENIRLTRKNAPIFLNFLWALGLGNKNEILEKGEMATSVSRTESFASTGGWTLASGSAMDHYSKHSFIVLNSRQQEIVDRVSRNIYRPCCDNSTHFPDCNHGMAMLGFLELMASQGVPESEMYQAALTLNAFWFPNNYKTIDFYLKQKAEILDAKAILGRNFSSGSGYGKIMSQVMPATGSSQGGCEVQ